MSISSNRNVLTERFPDAWLKLLMNDTSEQNTKKRLL
jgi:hypothetical protein